MLTVEDLWRDEEAADWIARLGPAHGEDLALRVYTSRLIGREPKLVLHGGGNTSVKTRVRDRLGDELDVICVKGSGSDLADATPAGLPALELAPLRRLRGLQVLDDDAMVAEIRRRLLDPSAPNPSIETLLHAFLPHRFVDHTHADAILVLTNQPDGDALVREALGPRVVTLPWIMPGFPLAQAVATAYERQPDCEGVVLLQHGIFTFAETARASYARMIEFVNRAAEAIARRIGSKRTMLVPATPLDERAAARRLAEVAPVVRGRLALKLSEPDRFTWRRMIAQARTTPEILAFAQHPQARELLATGPLTPDHVIRTKGPYWFLTADEAADPERCEHALAPYVGAYLEYCRAHPPQGLPPGVLPNDLMPRVVVVQGAGLLAFGPDPKAAQVAADIGMATLRGKALAAAIGRYTALGDRELAEMEFWPLELRKLGARKPPLLAGQVALVTGAGGAIGHGIAAELLAAGACCVLTDVDAERLERVRELLGAGSSARNLHCVVADVTEPAAVADLFLSACRAFGGVDIVVPNAGIAHVSPLAEMDPAAFERVLRVNVTGTMLVLREAARLFARQRSGGSIVVQASKNVLEPGASFGAYSASKAGVAQLAKIAALELAPLDVRVNIVNADAVFGGVVPSGLWEEVGPERMRARGLDADGLREFYRERSLLKQPVLPADVGRAVVFFAAGLTPTTGATLPVDGGIPGAFPR